MADATSSPAPAATVVAASAAPPSARPAFLAAARPLLPRLPLARNPGPQVGHHRVADPPGRGDTASGLYCLGSSIGLSALLRSSRRHSRTAPPTHRRGARRRMATIEMRGCAARQRWRWGAGHRGSRLRSASTSTALYCLGSPAMLART